MWDEHDRIIHADWLRSSLFVVLFSQMESDHRTNDVTNLTLSYTFFPVDEEEGDSRTEEEKHAAALGVRLHGSIVPPEILEQMKKNGQTLAVPVSSYENKQGTDTQSTPINPTAADK
jgi:hypothetical protein